MYIVSTQFKGITAPRYLTYRPNSFTGRDQLDWTDQQARAHRFVSRSDAARAIPASRWTTSSYEPDIMQYEISPA